SDRHEVADALKHGVRHVPALDGEAGDRLRPEPHSGDDTAGMGVGEGCAVAGGLAKLVVETFEVGWPGAVELPGIAIVEDGGAEIEQVGELTHELFGKGLVAANEKDGAAKTVKAFEILLALDGVEGTAFGLGGQAAADERGAQKAEQGDPVLRVSDG